MPSRGLQYATLACQTQGMTNADLAQMTTAELADLADQLRCPDGLRTPYNSRPLPTSRPKLVALIEGMRQRDADARAIERQGRR